MTQELPKAEPEDPECIQFRGRQTSVLLEDFGIRFQMIKQQSPAGTFLMHEPLPIASERAIQSGNAPENAVAAPVAEELTHGEISNPLICYGVVCEFPDPHTGEICGDVFPSMDSLIGHLSSHTNENQRDADSTGAEAQTGSET